ncbi:protease modulator HflC [Gynuella sunshinyii]|uniref:Protein HflC n=1 Tax=Gynuella sunshinyii YC6258 TaxID=1445510 RepID=A0A0C5VRP4_9GAMM|nr:protease modulator HflC [Gynuella sunshinyii]AJQ96906.1 membrane protease subunit, stomatin/prohibitin-like protein [Gynuella sunshinyii YC6258]
MRKYLIFLGVLIVLVYLASTSMLAVPATEQVVITQFGKPVRVIADSGLAFKWPDPIQTAVRVDSRLQLLQLEPAEFVTRDRRNLVVRSFVVWRVQDPEKFLASVRDATTAEIRLADLAGSEVGSAIGRTPLSSLLTAEVEQNQTESLFAGVTESVRARSTESFGIDILAVRSSRIGFPQQNLKAIYNRMSSEREKIARQYRAEGQEQAARIKAETELEVRKLLAEARRDSQIVKGQGEAEAAKIYADAYQQNAEYYRFYRLMDAYDKILNKDTQFILSTDSPLLKYFWSPPVESDHER